MTPEKRPAEDELSNLSKKPKEDDVAQENIPESVQDETVTDETSQDSVVSATSTSSTTTSEGKKKLSLPDENGTLVFCGCCQWDLPGKKNMKATPAMVHYVPRIVKSMIGIKVAFVAAHCSSMHAVILTAEGKTMTMGKNEKGQLGVGDTAVHTKPVVVESMDEFTVVSAAVGRNHTLFLTDRGSVFGCGDNKSGQCGIGNATPVIHTPCRISFKQARVAKVSCGAEFSMIIDSRGYLYSFGLPEYGQLGHNSDGKYFVSSSKLTYSFETSPRRVPVFVERSKGGHPSAVSDVQIVDVACGNNHTVVVDARKRVYSWGFGGYGRLGHAEPKDEMVPRLIKFFEGINRGVSKVFCGATYTIAMSDMGVFLWGQTKRTGEANMYPKPVQDLFGWDVRSIGCSSTSIVVAADRSCIAWGPSPTYGELGLGDNIKSSTAAKEVKAVDGIYTARVTCSQGFTLFIAKVDDQEDKDAVAKLKEVDL